MVPLKMSARPLAEIKIPDLLSYDIIVVSSSAGKDSQCTMDVVVECAKMLGILDRVVVLHCNLGRVEWHGTSELARAQAAHYGLRFVEVRRQQNDLIDQIRARRVYLDNTGRADKPAWPSSTTRYCTSDQKRGPSQVAFTALADEIRPSLSHDRVRILNCMGFRAEESPYRADLETFYNVPKATTQTTKHVDVWLPIHRYLLPQVWQRIRESGCPWHYAYDLGMPRLSCCFCIFAPEEALLLSGFHNPDLLDVYVEVEEEGRFDFRVGLSLASIRKQLKAGHVPEEVPNWQM